MATLDFRGWRIESDSSGWALGKPKTRLNKNKQREIFLEFPSYYSTLNATLQGLLERELRESDAASIIEVLALLREMRQELKELVPA